MTQLTWHILQPNDKPQWLVVLEENLTATVRPMNLEPTPQNWRHLKAYIDSNIQSSNIQSSRERGLIRAEKIETKQVTDEGVTAIHLFRNNTVMAVIKWE